MSELLETLSRLSLLVFVIGSMASMGLSLAMKQIIDPLKNVKLVILAIVLPLLLGGVKVNPMDIPGSLIILMRIPLAIGLFILMPIAGEIGKRSPAT